MDFNDLVIKQILLIDQVFMKKNELHSKYNYLFERIIQSDKTEVYKLILSKRLLTRLIRESNKILVEAQNKSTEFCIKNKHSVNTSYNSLLLH